MYLPKFSYTPALVNYLGTIERLYGQLISQKLIPSLSLKLQEENKGLATHYSTSIEGNPLTPREVTNIVLGAAIPTSKSEIEVKNYFNAVSHISVAAKKHEALSISLCLELHKYVMHGMEIKKPGSFRDGKVIVGHRGMTGLVVKHDPPEHTVVGIEKRLRELFAFMAKPSQISPLILSGILHHEVAFIHPFFDGNGRTSRLTMNIVLMKSGYPLVLILKNDRKKYYQALEKADKGNYIALVKFIAQAVERSLDIYLKTLTPSSKKREKFLLLSEISSKTPYSTKYLNLLARQGKLEAHKQGRNWLTTIEAVERYIERRERKRKLN